MLHTRSWFLCGALLAAGCGARTIADEYRDGGPGPGDVPPPDAPPDAPPDLPVDVPATCPPGQLLCTAGCVDTRSDPRHCGGCDRACLPSQTCTSGVCSTVCAFPQIVCGGACVDPGSDANNCGRCGVACGRGGTCVNGVCQGVACVGGLTLCGRLCVDLRSDAANCGFCGNQCAPGSTCASGRCVPDCPAPRTRCGDACADTQTDPAHCGACGMRCAAGSTCQRGLCRPMTMTGPEFRIEALTADGCRTVEHSAVTGDDRGGIAIGNGQVFYSGDTTAAGFDLDTLTPRSRVGRSLDGIFGEVNLGLAFTLASNRTPFDMRTTIVDAVLQVGESGAIGTTPVPLSNVIFLDRAMVGGAFGIFSGAQRAVVTYGPRAWVIQGSPSSPAPTVTELSIAPIRMFVACETQAIWGVAEFFEGAPWVAYVQDGRTIVRQNLFTGATQVVASFTSLSDMCSFTVSPSRGRWYFHHEGASQFRSGDETLGYCNARFRSGP